MKRFVLVAAVAAVFGLGTAATARAQYIIPYAGVTPNGGYASGNSIYNPGSYQSYGTYVSPFGTVNQQSSYTNAFGTYGVARGYNPYTGFGYTRTYSGPGTLGYTSGFGYGSSFGYSPNYILPPPIVYPSYSFGTPLYYRR